VKALVTVRAALAAAALSAAAAQSTALAAAPGAGAAAPLAGVENDIPYLDSPDNVTQAMLALAGVGPRDMVYDLGSGDGRIVVTAAKRFGARGLGVEIVPALVTKSRAYAQAAGVADRAEFREQDLFTLDLSPATVVTMYLLPEINLRLRPRLLAMAPGTRVVSHDWGMGDWQPDRTVTLPVPNKAVGREKLSHVHLWTVPAPLAGRWCGTAGRELALQAAHQFVGSGQARQGTHDDGQAWSLQGRIEGATARLWGPAGATMTLRWQAGTAPAAGGTPAAALQVTTAEGAWAGWAGTTLAPCAEGTARIPAPPPPATRR
jgi:SAM-dependent methyltransferase